MNISDYRELVWRFLKNYRPLVVPVVILVIALLLFIPTRLMGRKLRATIKDESIQKGAKTIDSLRRSVVASSQWTEEEKYQSAHASDANEIAQLARQSTQRELLTYKMFPKPESESGLVFNHFGKKFREALEGVIDSMNACDCPTDAELRDALQGLTGRSRRGYRWSGRRGPRLSSLGDVETKVVEFLCRKKAESGSIYATAEYLGGYEFWENYERKDWSEAVQDCWYSQLAYWMIEDVSNTIRALNSGSNSVLTSPVKRLVGMSFTTGRKATVRGRADRAAEDKPAYVLSAKDALTESCTARFSNEGIDVAHFNVSVVVSTKDVFRFMQELCSAKEHKFRGYFGELEQAQAFGHNQITILESRISSFDLKGREHMWYRYGEDAVVRLDLLCEYIFNNDGYDKIKPEAVKEFVKAELKEQETQKLRRLARAQRGTSVKQKKKSSGISKRTFDLE